MQELLTRGFQIVSRKLYCLLWLGGAGYHQHTQPGGDHVILDAVDELVAAGKLKPVRGTQTGRHAKTHGNARAYQGYIVLTPRPPQWAQLPLPLPLLANNTDCTHLASSRTYLATGDRSQLCF